MKFVIECFKSLTKFEKYLWILSCLSILILYLILPDKDYLVIIATLIGATSLIFIAKGNVLGPIISIIFSIIYGYISFKNRYYGELFIYLLLNLPLGIISTISWFKNRFKDSKIEVEVNVIKKQEYPIIFIIGILAMVVFYFILRYFNTAALLVSTLSIFTSVVASILSIRRSPLYAIAYSFNDIILIILWSIASVTNIVNLCMVLCFVVFLINDLYGFINWTNLRKKQLKQ